MKHFFILTAALLTMTACTTANTKPAKDESIGMANPASTYCVEQGGKLSIQKDKDGNEYGLCHLPDGRVVEEWEFFRANH